MDFSKIEKEALIKIKSVEDLNELDNIRLFYLGKKGLIPQEMKKLGNLSAEERKEVGKNLNNIKNLINSKIEQQKISIQTIVLNKKVSEEKIDLSLPGHNYEPGKIHPITKTLEEVINIFSSMGFVVAEGPDIETDFNNFTALNIPPDHPAREMQDTFYITDNKKR